jgi:pilus assembly protein CpaC
MTVNRPILGLRWRAARWVAPALIVLASLLAPSAGALEIIDSSGGVIFVEVNKGRLLRLEQAPATVFLADPNVADLQFKSSKLVYVIGKATGETSLFALDRQERVMLNRKVVVGYDLDQLNAAIETLIPNSGIAASMVNSTLVLDGVLASPAEAEQVRELARTFIGKGGSLLNRMKVSMANQVNLRVMVAEVQRSVSKEFAFDFMAFGNSGSFVSALAPFASPFTAQLDKTLGTMSLSATLKALETEGLVTVLAEPNLTALSGETASFLAGGELPFATINEDGQVTVEFKDYGVSLSFTPTILDRSRISMKVRPEVSQISGITQQLNGVAVRGINTRRAETTVELGDGESLVLAGLLQRSSSEDVNKIPGLGDVPIIGALFRSQEYAREETELMIVVTPYIVRPTTERIALPTDGYQAPNDYERIMWGGMYHESTGEQPARVATSGGQHLVGFPGFKVE